MAVRKGEERHVFEDRNGREKEEEEQEEEYEFEEVSERIKSSVASRFNLISNELGLASNFRKFSRESLFLGIKDLSTGLVIHPDNRYVYRIVSYAYIWIVWNFDRINCNYYS